MVVLKGILTAIYEGNYIDVYHYTYYFLH